MAKIDQISKDDPQWQADCLKWRGKILRGKYRHWCFDWDELPMDDTCREWPCGCYEVKCDHHLRLVGQRGPEVLIWKCRKCGKELS